MRSSRDRTEPRFLPPPAPIEGPLTYEQWLDRCDHPPPKPEPIPRQRLRRLSEEPRGKRIYNPWSVVEKRECFMGAAFVFGAFLLFGVFLHETLALLILPFCFFALLAIGCCRDSMDRWQWRNMYDIHGSDDELDALPPAGSIYSPILDRRQWTNDEGNWR